MYQFRSLVIGNGLCASSFIARRGSRCLFCQRRDGGKDLTMVEARHQPHIAVSIAHHHKRGVGDAQRRLVITSRRLLPAHITQADTA